jgi:predicted DNA binding protein
MILIADVSVPSDAFPLGQQLDGFSDTEIELERLVSLTETVVPLFWVDGDDAMAITDSLSEHPETDSVQILTEANGRALLELRQSNGGDGLVGTVVETDAHVLHAEGASDIWDFRLQFRSRDRLVEFRECCADDNIPLTLRRLYNPTVPADSGRLTDSQYEALVTAFDQGYFEVPRATSMDQLAAEFGISDSALSQRLRRGTSALIAETLVSDI